MTTRTGLIRPTELRWAPSRTHTAPRPVQGAVVARVEPIGGMTGYAGAVARPAAAPFVPGDLAYPIDVDAIQVFATGPADGGIAVVVDLLRDRDISRIELYGNLLLPPVLDHGRPRFNFGVPRNVAIAVAEEPREYVDRHRQSARDAWMGPLGDIWHPRLMTTNLVARWGWTVLRPHACYGRYVMLHFTDPPMIFDETGAVAPGIDVPRIVIYERLEDVEHRPRVEYVPLGSWSTSVSAGSAYWASAGAGAPTAETHQSIFRDPSGVICAPSALAQVGHRLPTAATTRLYSSDRLAPDHWVHLVLETTTDERPILAGVRLHFLQPAAVKLTGALADLVVRVDTTDDPEAALSPSAHHLAWVEARGELAIRASQAAPDLAIDVPFAQPVAARYVRISARIDGIVSDPDDARFVLRGLDVLRCRDFVIAPEPTQDVDIDYVVLRLRGPDLFTDYAYVDGRAALNLTIEVKEEAEAFQPLVQYRSLLDLLENVHTRTYSNSRFGDKPVQVWRETVDTLRGEYHLASSGMAADLTTTVLPEYGNRTIQQTSTITAHNQALPEAPQFALGTDVGEMTNDRKNGRGEFLSSVPALQAPGDLGDAEAAVVGFFNSVRENLWPFQISIGGNGAANVGVLGVGASVSLSAQVGGDVTRTTSTGRQQGIAASETHIQESRQRNTTTQHQFTEATHSAQSEDIRQGTREDLSVERRRAGLQVQYAGAVEDILLAAIPVKVSLRGAPTLAAVAPTPGPGGALALATGPRPRRVRDVLRVRIDHVPPSCKLDVEFRGTLTPRDREG